MEAVVISLSGGMDSAVLLAGLIDSGYEVTAVNFRYGSKHGKHEQKAAREIAQFFNISIVSWDLTNLFSPFASNLLQGGGEIPEGHYTEESMSQTVVPGRNMIFASILAGYAQGIGAHRVALAVHSGDHAIYPDCRPEFISNMQWAVYHATDGNVQLDSPFLHCSKGEIVAQGLKVNTPFHLTRTCYKDQPVACGKCGACNERLEAFHENDVKDPLTYEER